MPWLRLRTRAPAAEADRVASQLETAGAAAVTLRGSDDQNDATAPGRRWRKVAVEGLFPVAADLSALPNLAFDSEFLADEDWSATWRRGLDPLRFGRLHVASTTHTISPRRDEPVLRLDPGLAFGTGTHPTTAACLHWLAARPLAGQRVLDVGCGSGILALAAYKLGAAEVAGVDNDPKARCASARNAAQNEVPLTVYRRLEEVTGRFDVAVANILANTLCGLAAELAPRAQRLVLAGVLLPQVDRVRAAYPGFAFAPPVVADGWAMLSGSRRAASGQQRAA